MAATKLADVIVPEVFNPNVIERTSEKTALIQSGVMMDMSGEVDIGSGKTIELPFYQDLSGADDVWSDTTDVTLNKIGMSQDTAAVLTRLKAWGSSDLARALGQDDPMDAISDLVSDYWARRRQATLVQTLSGAMAAVTENVLDISTLSGGASNIDGEAFVDATQKLGDHSDDITDVIVHSATEAYLRKNDLITYVRDSEGRLVLRDFQGRTVHIDDGMPVTSGVYTTYLFAKGSVGLVDEEVENANEPYRHPEKNGGTDALYTRRKFIIHPRGVRWTPGSGVPSSSTPSNTELGASGNWSRVWEPQNIKIVQFKHRIG